MNRIIPINDELNNILYEKYKALVDAEKNVVFDGKLEKYKHYDMNKMIERASVGMENI